MQEINLIFGARNGEFRITPIMLNEADLFNPLTIFIDDYFTIFFGKSS